MITSIMSSSLQIFVDRSNNASCDSLHVTDIIPEGVARPPVPILASGER